MTSKRLAACGWLKLPHVAGLCGIGSGGHVCVDAVDNNRQIQLGVRHAPTQGTQNTALKQYVGTMNAGG